MRKRLKKRNLTPREMKDFEYEMATVGVPMCKSAEPPFGVLLKNSMVAVFDIMGFKAIIKQMSSPGAMQQLAVTLNTSMTFAKSAGLLKRIFPKLKNTIVDHACDSQNNIKVYWFSDTIILVKPDFRVGNVADSLGFMELVVDAYNCMFEKGFALRGCIDYGDCLRCDKYNYLLGLPFVRAMQSAEGLDFMGLIINEGARAHLSSKVLKMYGGREIDVRVNKKDLDTRYCVNWLRATSATKFRKDAFKKKVDKVSQMHGKTINARVRNLNANTVDAMAELMRKGGAE